ncbi:MAG: biotin synthase BioB [Acidobacteria bacterium]|nr:biotin synthase BioB [Acidobacteriota bacterium]
MEEDTLTRNHVAGLYGRGLLDLVYEAAGVHRRHHDPAAVQCASLLSVKTGGCPEDCAYCPQSAHYDTGVASTGLMRVSDVAEAAARARAGGADRFCIGAAWRQANEGAAFDQVVEMIGAIKAAGLESCATLGMLDRGQAERLREAGLDYYNHNLDSGRDFYASIVTTRSYDDRLDTLRQVREAGIKVCCGGILGMGESHDDRIDLLFELARQCPQPESVPINTLVAVEGTPLAARPAVPWDDVVRMIATARILMPQSKVRLSAGRLRMGEVTQALCFLAGANSIFLGDRLLTTPNPEPDADAAFLQRLGLHGDTPAAVRAQP